MNTPSGISNSLHSLAQRLKRQHAGSIAVLIDLSNIPAIHDRIMFRSLARFIEERTLDESIEAVPLARNILVLLAVPEAAQKIRQKLDGLSLMLQDQRHGAIRVTLFDLEKQADVFTETARRLMEQAPAPRSERGMVLRDEPAPDFDALARGMDLHKMLWQADLSSQSRRQVLWRIERNAVPEPVADEIWVSIDAIERATGIDLHNNIWLFGKATELLDQRMLAMLAADPHGIDRPHAFNLHLATIVGEAFRRMVQDKPAAKVAQMAVEVPLLEWRVNADVSKAALAILQAHRVALHLDGIRPEDIATLTPAEWQSATRLKFDAQTTSLVALKAALAALPEERRQLLPEKGIFCHCDGREAVEAGLEAGIAHFQGRGLLPLLEDDEAVETLIGPEALEGLADALRRQ